jgi:integrase
MAHDYEGVAMRDKPKPPATPEHRRRIKVKNHPGVYKRGSCYQVSYSHQGKRLWKSFPNLTEASRFKGRANAGDTLLSSRQPFIDYAAHWIESYQGRTGSMIRENTRESYRHSIRLHALPYFGRIKLDEIDARFLKGYVDHLAKKGLAPRTVRRYFAPIRAMLATAYEEDLLRRNPAFGFRVVVPEKNAKPPKERLTAEQTRALIAEIPPEHSDFVYLLAATGLRVNEGLGLTWGDFTQDREGHLVVHVRNSKTNAGVRESAVSSDLARRLLKRREATEFSDDRDPIFPNSVGNRLDDHNFRRRIYRPAANRAGVPWSTPHDLRHGLATLMAEKGFSAAHIATQLGHADGGRLAQSTYIHLDRLKSTDFVDEVLAG